MQLNYEQKGNGMYILSRKDIENIATEILKEYSPENLEYITPLDTADFLENYLGLTLKKRYIGTMKSGILGLIVMNDMVEIPSYDEDFNQVVLEETYGTVLISPSLFNIKNMNRKRYTEVHEAAHYILHKQYYSQLQKKSKASRNMYIACRKVELHNKIPKTNSEWMEWQADTLAAALLMPQKMFTVFAKAVLYKYGIFNGYIMVDDSTRKGQARNIIKEIAEKFCVSYRAAQIRMLHLGLIKDPYVY